MRISLVKHTLVFTWHLWCSNIKVNSIFPHLTLYCIKVFASGVGPSSVAIGEVYFPWLAKIF